MGLVKAEAPELPQAKQEGGVEVQALEGGLEAKRRPSLDALFTVNIDS